MREKTMTQRPEGTYLFMRGCVSNISTEDTEGIHPFSFAYLRSGRDGSKLSEVFQTLLSPDIAS